MPNAAASSDEDLMLAYAHGEVAAFTTLYDRHERGLRRFILRSVRQAEVADDLAQEVWMRVLDHALSYEPRAKFRTWLFTIAHHRVIDAARVAKPSVSIDAEEFVADTLAADSRLGPLRQLQSNEEAFALLRAVEQLPTAQREAFLLQAEGDFSVEEIAQATGTTFETAKSRLRYARNALRTFLAAHEEALT
jgi:RNA polymerase sigma factor (sigma-70 family)